MDKAILSAVLRRMEQRRAEHEAQAEQRRWEIAGKIPRVAQIDRELKSTAIRAVRTAFASGEDSAAAIELLKSRNLALQQEKRELLSAHGYPSDYLAPASDCPLCKDTGYVGSKLCDCVRRQCAEEQTRQLSTLLPVDKETFSTFSLMYYSQTPAKVEGLTLSPYLVMKDNLDCCREYADTFGTHTRSLLLYGAPGLGKTFLSSCIAREVIQKSFSVAYNTAISIFSCYDTVKFGGGEQPQAAAELEKYKNADLLIIDDLGTEMKSVFTVSCLYDLLNRRIMRQKCTIINTNLSPKQLESRYSEAISSRILGTFIPIRFIGTDIRKRKNAEII